MDKNKKIVLCIDDESIIINSLQEQLENHFKDKFIYETAESAEEALELIDDLDDEGQEIDIIICDWLMPGMKGDEFFLQIDLKYPKTVKILLTGQADQSSVKKLQSLADKFLLLAKPWNKEDLINIIKRGIGNYE